MPARRSDCSACTHMYVCTTTNECSICRDMYWIYHLVGIAAAATIQDFFSTCLDKGSLKSRMT